MYNMIWIVSGGGWVNSGNGRSVVTSQFAPARPASAENAQAQGELLLMQEKVSHYFIFQSKHYLY